MRQSLVVSVFSFMLAFCISAMYWLLRTGFLDNSVFIPLRVLGVSAFILFLPLGFSYFSKFFPDAINRVFFNDTIVPVYGLILMALIGVVTSFLDVNVSLVFSVGGYILFIVGAYFFYRQIQVWNKILLIITGCFFALWVGSVCWYMVLKPFIVEGWTSGTDKIDTLFHLSIAQMIKTYGIPSTGLDGVPFMSYHWGSHWLFAQLSNFLDLPVVVIYQLGFPVVIAPLLFRTFLSFVLEVKQYYKPETHTDKLNFFFWFVFFVIFIGFVRNAAGGNNWSIYFSGGTSTTMLMLLSESYTVSIILMFGVLSVLLSFWKQLELLSTPAKSVFLFLFLPIWIMFIGLAKVSTLYVVCCLIGYLYLRLKLFKSIALSVGLIFLAIVSFGVFRFVFETQENHGSLELFSFYKNFNINVPLFLLIFYIWTVAFIIIYVVKEKLKFSEFLFTARSIPLECVLVVSIVGFLPTAIVRIQNYDSLYFTEIQMWISAALVMAYIPFYKIDFNLTTKKWVIFSIPCGVLLFVFYLNTKVYVMSVLGDSINTHKRLFYGEKEFGRLRFRKIAGEVKYVLGGNYAPNKVFDFMQKLKELDKLPPEVKSKTLVYVNFREMMKRTDYDWGLYCHNIPFIVPSLTGMAMLDGIDITYFDCVGGSCCENIGMGYHYYPKWKSRDQIDNAPDVDEQMVRVAKKGFQNLIFYNLQTEAFENVNVRRRD